MQLEIEGLDKELGAPKRAQYVYPPPILYICLNIVSGLSNQTVTSSQFDSKTITHASKQRILGFGIQPAGMLLVESRNTILQTTVERFQ